MSANGKANRKTVRFECRMSPSEAASLDKAAKSAGLTRSDYVRSLIDGRTVQVVRINIDARKIDKLLHELKKSGTNMNQIARRLNRGDRVAPNEFFEMVEEHKAAALKVSGIIDEMRPAR